MTTNKNSESSKGDGGPPPPPPPPAPGQLENLRFHGGNAIFKSGPLFISSKGIGWTSWKKRWFILTRTSLVFFRSDPSAIPQKGSEVNLTLGGIDLNNSGSVAVKADKKLLTVLFHDGRDGRAFTLKAESSEDLYEWKTALENALARAPGASLVTGQNGIFQNDQADGADGFVEQLKDKQPVKSLVIGRPILLALEDVDGSPSFLEKALKFIEDHGVQVEGILRQAADVDDVEHRIKEFEQGITEFSPKEDAHVIADCVKYFLRELPSSPVPTSCCNALLEACRTDRGSRVNAMRVAICEMFPEPNRRLLQRILLMMQTVASHKALNRMSTSAVAACMAPLLLRPLLAGDCEIESNFNVGGDGSIQLLKAAAAANHAQAIVITLLEEYEKIFSEGSLSPGLYSDSDECGSEDEEVTDDDESYVDDATEESDVYTDDDHDSASSGTCTQSCESREDDLSDYEGSNDHSSGSKSPEPEVDSDLKVEKKLSSSPVQTSLHQHDNVEKREDIPDQSNNSLAIQSNKSDDLSVDVSTKTSLKNKSADHKASPNAKKPSSVSNGHLCGKHPTVWGRTSAKKNLSMESIDYPIEDDVEIQKLEASKIELQNRISEEKKADHEEITQADANVANLKRKVNDLGAQLNQQHEQHSGSMHGLSNQPMNASLHESKWNDELKDAEVTGTSQFRRPASKDTCMDGTKIQKLDLALSGNSRPLPSTNSKRSSTRSEGVNSTTSALTRLTTRLNFLKERRSQIANEIQNLDKGRGSDQNLEKSQGSEILSFQNLEKDKGLGKERAPPQKSEKSTPSDGQSLQDLDGGQSSEGEPRQSLQREILQRRQRPTSSGGSKD
ncbi:RHO GTPASE-ACTIVATING PROTEIN REN1 [Salix viminalis]|uniref:RHO GTPASE-ACTIVATING PROTEIN REN1 n=1 Tax=Salix viminalis TaxID=40686 RepID=A0A9Q0USN7_SALVM|nr:RHO GTPASE-ACTIVATING PROTEIN REN1 [Salix viminalis]